MTIVASFYIYTHTYIYIDDQHKDIFFINVVWPCIRLLCSKSISLFYKYYIAIISISTYHIFCKAVKIDKSLQLRGMKNSNNHWSLHQLLWLKFSCILVEPISMESYIFLSTNPWSTLLVEKKAHLSVLFLQLAFFGQNYLHPANFHVLESQISKTFHMDPCIIDLERSSKAQLEWPIWNRLISFISHLNGPASVTSLPNTLSLYFSMQSCYTK